MRDMKQPRRPNLVLRVGFVGNRWGPASTGSPETAALPAVPPNEAALKAALSHVLAVIEHQLAVLATDASDRGAKRIREFFSNEAPLLRLVTGLAEGADQLAAAALHDMAVIPGVRHELAAVLPCDAATYRQTREAWHQPDFDASLARCAFVLELDGLCAKPQPDTPSAQERRARAYRAQATFLLRQCDVLLAVADLGQTGRAGGTLETLRRAMAFQLPVVLVDIAQCFVHLVQPTDDLSEVLARGGDADWRTHLCEWVSTLVAGPDLEPLVGGGQVPAGNDTRHATATRFLEEYFAVASVPPRDVRNRRVKTHREWLWGVFSGWFLPRNRRRRSDAPSDHPLLPFADWRARATELTYHFSGLYRGAFVLNYGLAVVAVTLATLSLVLIGLSHADGPDAVTSLNRKLLMLATLKLACILLIYRNTHSANHSGWNDKAIDYRYLSERLRCAFYLPRLGSGRPPIPAKAQFTSRVLRQSAVDWLFEAMTRDVSPVDVGAETRPAASVASQTLRVQPAQVLEQMQSRWMASQLDYHRRNAVQMRRMHDICEKLSWILNLTVIAAVGVDLLVLALSVLSRWLPESIQWLVDTLHHQSPWLIFVAAVLPATVASLNGVRFQTECQRLADRSEIMQKLLLRSMERAQVLAKKIRQCTANPAVDIGSWSSDVLLLGEYCARELVEEATEWSVLYAKDIKEP